MMRTRAPFSIPGSLNLAVVQELEDLLRLARLGELIGLAYVAMDDRKRAYMGRAGLCHREPTMAGGALLRSAIRCVSDDEPPP